MHPLQCGATIRGDYNYHPMCILIFSLTLCLMALHDGMRIRVIYRIAKGRIRN